MQGGRQPCWDMMESGTGSARSFTSEPGVPQGEEGLASSRSQSGMRAGDDDRRDDGATARGRAPEFGFPPSRSQSGMRLGDDVRRDDRATARGRALGMESPLLSLPVRDASRGRRWRYHEGTRGTNKLGVF